MKQRLYKFCLIPVFLALLITPPRQGVIKAQNDTVYVGLDIVFLIDQSGSMGGPEAGCTVCSYANDPLGLRFAAPEFAIDLLGDSVSLLNQQTEREEPVDVQVAIINFGSTAQLDVGPVVIDATTEDEWIAEWNAIQSDLAQNRENLTNVNLQKTNHKAAFERAVEAFAQMQQNVTNGNAKSGERLRAMILLTDGGPCVEDCSAPDNLWSDDQIREYLTELQADVRGTSEEPGYFPVDEYEILVIAMKDPVDPYWGTTKQIWEQITNDNARLANTLNEVGVYLYQFLNPILQDLGGENQGEPWEFNTPRLVDPYLRVIVFTVFKSDESEMPISIEEAGTLLNLSNQADGRITISGTEISPILTIEIQNPQPGEWTVRKIGDSEVSVWAMPIEFQVNATSASLPNNYQFFPVPFDFALIDEHGDSPPVYVDPKYALQPEITLNWGSGQEQITPTLHEDGSYHATFTPVVAGVYTAHLRVTTYDVTNNLMELVNKEQGSFTIAPITLIPATDDQLWYQNTPVSLGFSLVDDQDNQVMMPEPDVWNMTIRIVGPNDTPELQTSQADGVHVTSFTPASSGEYQQEVEITGQDHLNNPFVVFTGVLQAANVRPTTSLDFTIDMSFTGSEHVVQADIGWFNWRFGGVGESQPYSLTVQLQTASGTPIAATEVGEGNNQPFQATLQAPDGTEQTVTLQATNQPGQYQALVSTLVPTGTWTLDIAPQLNLVPDFLMNQESKTVTFNLVENPTTLRYQENWAFWFPKITSFLILLILALIIRRLIQARNPCQGQLLVEDEYGSPLFTFDLRSKRRNHIKVGKNKLRASTQLKGLDIYRPAGSSGVVVTATLRDGAQPLISRPMVHEDKVELTPDGLYLCYLNYASMAMDEGSTGYSY